MKTKLLLLLLLANFSIYAQTTAIPDLNFEKKLIALGIDSGNPDGKVLTSKISGLISLDVSNSSITDLTGIGAFKDLEILNCSNNQITSLNLLPNSYLTTLNCSRNALTALNSLPTQELRTIIASYNQIKTFAFTTTNKLRKLQIDNNILTSLTVYSPNTLEELNCDKNNLTFLNIYPNVALKSFSFNQNQISSIDLKQNVLLTDLSCWENQLTSLDVSKNTALVSLYCDSNKIPSLDLSGNTNLVDFSCTNNMLAELNLKNGNNTKINKTQLNLTSNPLLSCIKVDDPSYSNNNWYPVSKDPATSYNLDCNLYTLIPDLNFEKELISTGYDSGTPDGKVLTSKIVLATQLVLTNRNISDLTGIEAFASLKTLYVRINNLTTLDVSKNKALEVLDCERNKLTSLDVSNNPLLTSLSIAGNSISILNVENNTALKALNISKYASGTSGSLFGNFTSINLSKNTALESFECQQNIIEQLDLSNNLLLKELNCSQNQIKSLDLSSHKALTTVKVNNNKLVSLNLKNGQNNLLLKANIDLTVNPTLSCISVDDVDYSNVNWAGKKDAAAFYSPINCNAITLIPDPKFEDKLISLGIDTDGKNGLIATASAAAVTTLNVANSSITDLTGIQAFTSLTGLDVSKNSLSKLDLSKNTSLNHIITLNNADLRCIQVADVNYALVNWTIIKDTFTSINLDCTIYTLIPDEKFEQRLIDLGIDKDGKNGKVTTASISSLTTLNLNNSGVSDLTGIEDFTALERIDAENNQLKTLDFTKNTKLKTLVIRNNQLTSLNVDNCLDLEYLNCENNQLTFLDVSNNIKLGSFWGSTNKFTKLDFSGHNNLIGIYCANSEINTLKLPNNDNNNLTKLWCGGNKLEILDVSKNLALTELVCDGNQLQELNTSKNTALVALTCSLNKLKSLDISNNKSLTIFRCDRNNLESLNLKNGKNTILTKANSNFIYNPNLSCILVDDADYSNANWSTLKDTYATYTTDCNLIKFTLIPDVEFEKALIYKGIDNILDGKVLTSRIAVEKDLNLTSLNFKEISDLTGLEDFTSLEILTTPGNKKISQLNVSKNTALKTLTCGSENLTTLNLTNNKNLVTLYAYNNKLTTLNTSTNTALETISINLNLLNSVDLQNNVNLTNLYLNSNTGLTNVNVSKNIKLTELQIQGTSVNTLDVSANTKLATLICDNSKLTSLDVSKNTSLVNLNCSNNALKSLNLKNGKNTLFTTYLNFKNNSGLTCIQVDDVTYSTNKWSSYKDATASFNTDCTVYTLIPDSAFEDKLIALNIDKDGKNGKVATSSIASLTSLDISGSSIKDLTGIQDFTSLKVLNCSTNQLTVLNPASNPLLTDLNCSNNTITVLDVSKNPALTALNVSNNNLNSLNVKNGFNVNMDWFSVNFTKNPSLSCIQVDNAKYSNDNWNGKLDKTSFFTENCGSYTLIPDSNFEDKLIALNIDIDGKNGKVLTSTIASVKDLNVQLSDIKDLTGIEDFTALEFLNCQFNLLTSLNVSKNSKLIELYTHGNDLTVLNLAANPALTTLQVNKNKLTDLDLSKNTKLVYVNVMENSLKSLNLRNGNNTNFTGALLNKNTALTCILVDNPSFAASSGVFFKDTTANYSSSCSLGIEDSVFAKVIMYPNPTKGEVNINNVSLEKATVYNSLGQIVKSFTLSSANTDHTINLSGLPKGVYYIYLINEDAASAKKIILE
ncbi:T9SS type A sorting domain-containing protein [Flavobacterium notoginsengisoli]|uniref:T9SS type A sorting domain-containing protein n=1 Tax=Flavobacterium notoginsengisoli TaxID=1478199 RepID=UPI003645574B